MSERDDYLWNRSGSDPEVEELEELLGRYRYRGRRPRRWLTPVAAVAAVAAVLAVACLLFWPERTGWEMEWTGDGRSGRGRLVVGEWLATKADERVRIEVADIGHVDLEPESRVRLLRTDAEQHRLELRRGKIQASVSAPPRLFVVDTPAAQAVDLGCVYSLEVRDDGSGELYVLSGYVQLENRGGAVASYVPGGAKCSMHPDLGPGLPYFASAPAALRDLDPTDAAAVGRALETARPPDSLTLWHLLPRVDRGARERIFERLAAIEPPPAAAAREKVLALDPVALLAWRDELELRW